jgi:hypothetical protein
MRYDNAGDSLNPWKDRLPVITQMIRFHDFDIFGGQELLHNQVEGLEKNLTEYGYIGVGRDDGATKGEYSPVFIKKISSRFLIRARSGYQKHPTNPAKDGMLRFPVYVRGFSCRSAPAVRNSFYSIRILIIVDSKPAKRAPA